ncbi:MAG TPA: hypothetical protein PKE26_01750 [Kiritimatiellia bacterium]|nr:hypothetical protein [Kiritimatiellia bacterium]HMO97813.1 hypothetical protein [Kiritimatiellia bacterium]HMP96440.1 hypothetical protein [Kiritimatiellia bacterium]
MKRSILTALVLIGLLIVVLLMTGGKTSVNLVLFELRAATSMVILGATALGVVIGMLLK